MNDRTHTHMSDENQKWCAFHKRMEPKSNFGKNCQTPDGLMYYCRGGASEKQKQFRRENPESASASRKRYLDKLRARNRGKVDPAMEPAPANPPANTPASPAQAVVFDE